MEDLNHLLKNEQIELLKEQTSSCTATRATHRYRAGIYARRICEHGHPYRSGSVEGGSAFAPYPFGGEGRAS